MNNSKNLEKVSESILHEEVSNNQILCKTTLSIMDEFNQTYEDRIKYIEKEVGGECIELKYPVYCDWVRDLIIQNRTLVETLEELQREACQRLLMLEEKLRKDTIYFNGDNNYHKLENDLKNILEVIRRAREEQRWNADGLEFFDIKYEDIFGKKPENCDITQENNISMNVKITNEPLYIDTNSTFNFKDQEIESLREQLKQLRIDMKKKDAQIEEYTKSLLKLPSSLKQTYNDVDCDKIELNKHIQELKSIINEKDDQLRNVFEDKALLSNDILTLKETLNQKEKQLLQLDKASLDTHVLVVEVASKHDTIMKLRSDINILEERLRQADMQTHFKDDVIRGLRRDCRKLAQGSMFSRKYDPNQSVDRNLNIVYGRFDDKLSMSYEDNNEGDMESTLGGYDSDRTLMNSELEKNDENENKIVKLLRQELEQMVQQVRARETHILNQNSMILESQDKLDKIRIELKTITTDRDKILMQLSDLKIDTEVKEFQNLLVEMNEKIIMLEKENHELKYLKKQVKDDYLKDKVIKFDKGISVKFDDENERETQHLRELITNIFQELFENFGKELSNDVLEKLSIGDLSPVSQLILELKKEIETKDRLLFDKEQNCLIKDNELINLQKKLDEEKIANNELINNLRNFIKIQENNIYQLETNKNILEYELKELNETLTSFDNKTKGIREQKDKLEIECKNQQTTIYNLREVLEATAKRNNGNNVTVSQLKSSVTNSDSTTTLSGQQQGGQQNNNNTSSSMWNWFRNVHDV